MNEKLLTIINANKKNRKDIFFNNDKEPFKCAEDLLNLLINAVKKKAPFSMIRLGDGEGRILGYPDVFEKQVYINQVLTYQFGRGVLKSLESEFGSDYLKHSMLELKAFIEDAISNADIIGAPSRAHFRNDVTDKNIIALTAQSVCLQYLNNKVSCAIFDHFIFKAFHQQGFFQELLSHTEKLHVISHTDITSKLKQTFSLKECHHIQIPGHQSFMKSNVFHYPVVYKEITCKLNHVVQGELYFVAAGYLGKYYCNLIKRNGGIAIDIGSIFDGWCGIGRKDAIKNLSQRL